MKGDTKLLVDLILRYGILFILGLSHLYLIYLFLNPITLYSVGTLLGLFSSSFSYFPGGFVYDNTIFLLVKACVGGSAFYLLLILILTSRNLHLEKRLKVILFSFVVLLLFNVLRILLMVSIYDTIYFILLHYFIWYFLSTAFVVLIWMYDVYAFDIKGYPVLSDVAWLISAFRPEEKKMKVKRKAATKKKTKKKRKS